MTSSNTTAPGTRQSEGNAGSGRPSQSPSTKQVHTRFSDDDLTRANERLDVAFAVLGLLRDGQLVCPECGNSKKKTVQFKTSKNGAPYWKCFKCGSHSAATKLLQDKGGRTFVEAVNLLLGRDTTTKQIKVEIPEVVIAPAFEAVVDVEVYEHVRNSGSTKAAQLYWSTWHLGPRAVEQAGSTMIGDEDTSLALLLSPVGTPEHTRAWEAHRAAVSRLHKELVDRYGMERLKACGLVITTEKGSEYFLVNAEYPVIEAHEHPNGRVVGMQFRPVGRAKVRVDAHKAWKRRWNPIAKEMWPDDPTKSAGDAWKAAAAKDPKGAGEEHRYVTPFLSLKGAGTDSLVGCGLRRIAALSERASVYVIEGFKDLLAVRSMVAEGYAVPGTGNVPPTMACEVLKRHDVVAALDGDSAGEAGRAKLLTYFEEQGVPARPKPGVREDMDVTDILVERIAHTGCKCDTCTTWRAEHPADPQTCGCVSCTAWREKHPETPGCRCQACMAKAARRATEELVRSCREQLAAKR